MTATLKTHTLGCKVNQYETELVRQALATIGYRDATKREVADVCVVNTCTVTETGDVKSRQIIRRMARQNPGTRLVVMGCYATRAPDEIAAIDGVTEVLTDKRELPDLMGRFGVVDIPTGLMGHTGRRRAYVKVQDGCLLRCSYCIIPAVRPNLASRPVADIVGEVTSLVDAGHREVVLTGIHLGHYGVEWNRHRPRDQWTRLAHLVEKLIDVPGDFRIRLSSIEATEATRQLIDVVAGSDGKVAPHFHLCLQSGSDAVLRRMRRRWGTRMFVDRCELIRQKLDRPAITTDVIVGFPGETESEFEQTLQTCRRAGFSKIHAFPFSARRGTPAAKMADHVDPQTQQGRMNRVLDLETELQRSYYQTLVGMTEQMMVERTDLDGVAVGTTGRYAAGQVRGPYRIGDVVRGPIAAADWRGVWLDGPVDRADEFQP